MLPTSKHFDINMTFLIYTNGQNQGKVYMKFINSLAIGIAVILGLVGLIALSMAFGLYQGAQEIVESANEPIVQNIKKINGKIVITAPLTKEMGLLYENVDVCRPKGEDPFFKSLSLENAGYSCINKQCMISVSDINTLPESFFLYQKNKQGECSKKELFTKGHIQVISYASTIDFTETLKEMLDIKGEKFQVGSKKGNSVASWQIMGTKKSTFTYEKKVKHDTLLIDKKESATILYN